MQSESAPVPGATVSVTLKSPSGGTSVVTATTAANGTATVTYSLKQRDPSGTYQVQTVATKNGATGSGNGKMTFSVSMNTRTSPRTGTLTIAGETFTVTQDAGN